MKPYMSARARGAAALVAVAALTAGCSATSPIQTAETKAVADGVPVDLGDLQVRNLALVSGEQGDDATLTGTVENTSSEERTLQVAAAEGQPVTATIGAGKVVVLSSEGDKLSLKALDVPPGAMADLSVGAEGADTTTVSVPVLSPTGYYEDYAPDGWTPTPTPTESESSESAH